jgi:hypothetical protein
VLVGVPIWWRGRTEPLVWAVKSWAARAFVGVVAVIFASMLLGTANTCFR